MSSVGGGVLMACYLAENITNNQVDVLAQGIVEIGTNYWRLLAIPPAYSAMALLRMMWLRQTWLRS